MYNSIAYKMSCFYIITPLSFQYTFHINAPTSLFYQQQQKKQLLAVPSARNSLLPRPRHHSETPVLLKRSEDVIISGSEIRTVWRVSDLPASSIQCHELLQLYELSLWRRTHLDKSPYYFFFNSVVTNI